MSTTIDQLIAGAEVAIEAAEKRRDKAIAEARATLLAAQEDSRELSDEDHEVIDQANERRERAKTDMSAAQERLAQAQALKAEESEAERKYSDVKTTEVVRKSKHDEVVRVGAEERTYHRGNDPHGTTFLQDVLRSFVHRDPAAEHRLSQHMKEERVEREQYLQMRAVGTSAFTGLVVPQYLTDMYAPATAALRPFAQICNQHPLPPDGMSVNISRITQATSVELQATEGTAVAEQNMDDTLLTVNVQTNAGQQTLSRQVIDRGTGIEDIVFQDLFNRYHTNLDRTLLNQATNGLSDLSTVVAYTSGTPTGEELYPKIVEATSGVETALLGLGQPSHAVMHPRRWYWLQSQMVDRWPLINQPGIQQPAAGENSTAGYGNGSRGTLPNGLNVIVDANVSTTENADQDEVYVVPARECHLWEDANAPLFIRAEEPKAANLQVLLVVYGYFAYTFGRYPTAMQKVSGTGLSTPSF